MILTAWNRPCLYLKSLIVCLLAICCNENWIDKAWLEVQSALTVCITRQFQGILPHKLIYCQNHLNFNVSIFLNSTFSKYWKFLCQNCIYLVYPDTVTDKNQLSLHKYLRLKPIIADVTNNSFVLWILETATPRKMILGIT
jgi:hypothetical protein